MAHKDIGGQSIHIGDCQVWAAIYYLDSPTDYREFLPAKTSAPHLSTQWDFNMPSTPGRSCGSDVQPSCTWIIPILLLLTAALVLYLAIGVV